MWLGTYYLLTTYLSRNLKKQAFAMLSIMSEKTHIETWEFP